MARQPAVRTLGWISIYTAAAVLGLYTKTPDSPIALFWPAAGIAVCWLSLTRTRGEAIVALTTVATVVLVQASTVYASASAVVTVAAAHTVLAGSCGWLLRRAGGREPEDREESARLCTALRSARGLVVLVLAAVGASFATAPLIAWAVVLGGGAWSWETALAWTGRNAAAIVVVAETVAVLRSAAPARHAVRAAVEGADGHAGKGRWSVPGLLTPGAERRSALSARWEYAALVAVTLAATVVIFGVQESLPLAFVLTAVVAWAGARFDAGVVALHVSVTAVVIVVLTSQGLGVFAAIEDPLLRALVAQVFVMVCMGLGLLLAFGEERHQELAARLSESETAARTQADLLGAVTSSMADALLVVDVDGAIVLSNEVAESLLSGADAVNMADPSQHGFFLADGTPIRLDDGLHTRALSGETVLGELVQHVDGRTGERTFHSVSGAPLPTASGRRVAVFLLRDVTREQMHLRQVQGFAGMVAHDLKSPLASLSGWHQLLTEELDRLGPEGAAAASMAVRIGSSNRRMSLLIDDLLGYARAQAADHRPEPVDLDSLVAEIESDRVTTQPGVVTYTTGATLLADAVQLRQVMANLIGNALKYVTPGTTPRVRISVRSTRGWDEVVVDDNGVGIPAGQHEAVFDPFVRMHSGYEGTGLGLAICRTIADKHGGSLTARPGPEGVGTRMVLRLPSAAPVSTPRTARPAARPTPDRVGGALRPVESAEHG